MRVLMLSWEYPPHIIGGLGTHVTELAPALAAAGVEVHLVTPNLQGGPPEEQIAPGVTVYRVSDPGVARDTQDFVPFVQALNGSLERKGHALLSKIGAVDIVHGHDWLIAYSAVALKRALGLPLVATMHGTERGRGQGSLPGEHARAVNDIESWLVHEACRVITVSRFMADQIQHHFGLPREKIDVIHNGVSLPTIQPLAVDERRTFRRRFAADDEPLIFYVGRVVYEKGIHVLIDAVPRILERYSGARFVIAGTGGQLDALQHRARERGVSGHVHFTGFISDQERDYLFQVADVAVFPSLYEPFGIVALEAMCYHCPLVVAATGGLVEVVKLHETGMTSHPGDPESLAWAIIETLRHPDWAKARAENAFREIQELYSWGRIAAQTVDIYRRVHQEWQQGSRQQAAGSRQ